VANDRGCSGKGSVGTRYLPGQAVICPDCHGQRYTVIRGRLIPCSTGGGYGIASCCDGAVGCGLDVVNGELGGNYRISDGSHESAKP
jgi:hypothetical protein